MAACVLASDSAVLHIYLQVLQLQMSVAKPPQTVKQFSSGKSQEARHTSPRSRWQRLGGQGVLQHLGDGAALLHLAPHGDAVDALLLLQLRCHLNPLRLFTWLMPPTSEAPFGAAEMPLQMPCGACQDVKMQNRV